jgi:hypothetical protein
MHAKLENCPHCKKMSLVVVITAIEFTRYITSKCRDCAYNDMRTDAEFWNMRLAKAEVNKNENPINKS